MKGEIKHATVEGGGARKDPQLTSRLRSLLSLGDLLVQKDHSYVHSRDSLRRAPLSLCPPRRVPASSAVRVFKGRTKATGNCCRLFRRYGRFYICPCLLRRLSFSLPLNLSSSYPVHMCVSLTSIPSPILSVFLFFYHRRFHE